MRRFNTAMIVVWVIMGVLVLTVLTGSIAGDLRWFRLNGEAINTTYTGEKPAKPTVNSNAGRPPSGMTLFKQESFPVGDIKNIEVDAGIEDIVVRYSNNDMIVINQYGENGLSENRIAKIEMNGSALEISSRASQKKDISSWRKDSQLEILLPAGFSSDVDFSLSMGALTLEDSWDFGELNLHVSMGDLRCEKALSAKGSADIDAKMGEIFLQGLSSTDFNIHASAGDIKIERLYGSGDIECSMGSINVKHTTVVSELDLDCSMGDITVYMEKGQSFEFDGHAGMGGIDTWFAADVSGNMRQNVSATVGDGPYASISANVSMGNISIKEA